MPADNKRPAARLRHLEVNNAGLTRLLNEAREDGHCLDIILATIEQSRGE